VNIRTIHYYKDRLFVGTENGLFYYDYKSKKILDITPKVKNLNDFQVMQFLEYRNQLIAVTRKRGLYNILSESDNKVKLVNIGEGYNAFKIIPYPSKFLYSSTSGIFRQNTIVSLDGQLINGNVVWDYTQSKYNKTIYLASWNATQAGGGLLKLYKDTLIDVTKRYGIESEAIWAVKWLRSNQLVVGTLDKGVYLIDLQLNQLSRISLQKIKGRFEIEGNTCYFSEKKVYHKNGKILLELNEANLKTWMNQKGAVLQRLSDLTSSYKDLSLKGHRINSVQSTENGVFVSTTIGLLCFTQDFKLKRFIPLVIDRFHVFNNTLTYHKPYKEFNIFRNISSPNITREVFPITEKSPTDILHFQQIGDSTILWTKVKGAFVYRDNKKPYKLKLETEIGHLKSVSSWQNSFILVNSKDEVFIGQVSSKEITIKQIAIPIATKSIYNVVMHRDMYAIHFDKGIYVATPSGYRIINHTNMLSKAEITALFMTENQLEVVSDEFVQYIPISAIFNYTIQLPKAETSFTNKEIPSKENSLVLEVKTSTLQQPKAYTFYYQLNGQDSIPITDGKIYLMNLSSGSYKLNLLAYNGFTNSWTVLNSYSFTKEKAFWEKSYFWIIIGSIISLISVVIYYRTKLKRNKRLLEQQELEREVIQQKLQAIQAKMNPHFMFNALNSIQNYIIDTDTDNALLYLSEFAKLMRQTIEYSSMSTIPLAEEIEFLERYIRIEQMRFSSEIELVTVGIEMAGNVHIPPMILQPLIENAFIHGLDTQTKTKQQIFLKLEKKGDSLLSISISNPISNPNSSFKEHQSFGIKSIEQRLKLVNPKNKLTIKETEQAFTVQLEVVVND
jgi:sensor histidine kinase YesM